MVVTTRETIGSFVFTSEPVSVRYRLAVPGNRRYCTLV
jgi:hypothetical protein